MLSDIRSHMAEYGEWNRKGAALSEVTAEKEYGVTRDFIVKGIQAGKLEFREGAVWGNPYLRVLILLRHKFLVDRDRLAIGAAQHGHRGSVLTRAAMRRRRMVAIEFATWRSGRRADCRDRSRLGSASPGNILAGRDIEGGILSRSEIRNP